MDNTRIIKKVLYLFVTAVFAGFIFAGSACQAKQEFIVGFDAEFPPYGYMDENGDYTGFDLKIQSLIPVLFHVYGTGLQ